MHLQNVETIRLNGGTINGAITGSGQNDVFIVAGDLTGATPALSIGGLINGGSGNDELQLDTGAVVENINISVDTPTPGDVHVQGVETITLDGGTINGVIDASDPTAGRVRLNLISGVIGADFAAENTDSIFMGSRFNDLTVLAGDFSGDNPEISFIGSIDVGDGDDDEVRLIHGGVLPSLTFAPAGSSTTMSDGTVGSVRTLAHYETFTIDGGRVDVINAHSAAAAMTFNLISGQIGDSDPTSPPGLVLGSEFNDTFIIGANITINGGTLNGEMVPFGIIDGGDGMDVLRLAPDITPTRANFLDDILTLTFSGGGGITLTLPNIEIIDIDGLTMTLPDPGTGTRLDFGGDPLTCLFTFFLFCFERERIQPIMQTFATGTPTADQLRGAGGNDVFTITGDATGSALNINGVIDGQRGIDELQLNSGAVVASIAFSNNTPTQGGVHLQNVETITIDGGTVGPGGITAAAALSNVRFNLISGAVGGNITGSRFNDTFIIGSGFMISGMLDGGAGADRLSLASDFTTTAATFSGGTLTLTFSGSDSLMFTLANIEEIDIDGFVNRNPALTFTPTAGDDLFIISNAIGDTSAQTLNSVIDGEGGNDEFQLNSGAVVASIAFSSNAPTGGRAHLQSIETIRLDGGRVNGNIDASDATPPAGVTFNIMSGRISGDITGSRRNDTFNLTGGTIVGTINGGSGNDTFIIAGNTTTTALNIVGPIAGDFFGTDTLQLNAGAVVNRIIFSNAPPPSGDVHLRNIETITLNGGTVNGNIEGTGGRETFNLTSGTITENVVGGGGVDTFIIGSGIMISGMIDGGTGADRLSLASDFTTTEATFFDGILTLTFSGGVITLTLASIETIDIDGFVNLNPALIFTPTEGGDLFTISTTITDTSAQSLNNVIDGLGGNDVFQLNNGGVIARIAFSDTAPSGSGGAVHLQNVETITINGGTVNRGIDARGARKGVTFNLISGRVDEILENNFDDTSLIGSPHDDVFIVSGDIIGNGPALDINGLIQGGGGDRDEVRLVRGGVVGDIDFSVFFPNNLNLRSVEIITIDGGTVRDDIDVLLAPAGVTFNLTSGTIGGNVVGNDRDDVFNLYSAIEISGYLDGGEGSDTLRYAGASGFDTPARGGLAADTNISNGGGSVRRIESQEADATITSLGVGAAGAGGAPAGAGLRGLTVRGIEVLSLSPALNLYGALSDALMQFGAQTAQGFALADLNLATGRGTQMMSKDSPFTKGRIWAHKITHSGNGKGSIGLNLTGLTARAESDYDYEMSLTQHGFDAPVMTTKLGAFNLRAVSHSMTGTIETNVAQAKVSGYGAGVALLWQKHNLSAHLTSLASAYEVEAQTSPLNPQAVVSEISEGSFSAMNAVVSAGLADKREITYGLSLRTTADLSWQTLSLDDFNETGQDGIAVNFDKATRFTARVGAALETEHWFSDVVFVHETSSGGTLSSGLSQDYRQDDGTAFEMKFGGKVTDLATGLTLKAHIGLRASLINSATLDPSARLDLSWRF